MNYRPLGKTGILISEITLGTVKFGRNQQLKYPFPFQLPSIKELAKLLHVTRDLGINALDTARAYGLAEDRLGQLLQGQRHEWVIISKAGERFADGLSQFDFSQKALKLDLHHSLRSLKTDFLDVLLLHSDGNDQEIIEEQQALQSLADFKKEGLIRAFGISTKTVIGTSLALKYADVVMLTYNQQQPEELANIKQAAAQQVGVLIKKVLLSGHFPQQKDTNKDNNHADFIKKSLQYALVPQGVSSLVIGTSNPTHLRENCQNLYKT